MEGNKRIIPRMKKTVTNEYRADSKVENKDFFPDIIRRQDTAQTILQKENASLKKVNFNII